MIREKEYLKYVRGNFWGYLEGAGELGELFEKHYAATYEDGAFDQKTKRLMAMVGAIAAGCEECIIGQAIRAIDQGATKEEILEACSVALSLGGTMAGSKVSMVIQLLKDKDVF